MYCKGYNPTGFTGIYGDGTKAAIARFQKDAGLRNVDGVASSMIIKALLNMDAFINVGDDKIRTIQQNLNRDYYQLLFKPLGLIPCDGRYARSTNKALIYALQSEQGSGSPDGSFGSTTKSLCPTLNVGSTKTKFVAIIQYALYLNNYDPGRFDGIYDEGVKSAVRNFQSFTKLTADGVAGKQTWASLLVSTGDNTRKGTACDCITTITPAGADDLVSDTLVETYYAYKNNYEAWSNLPLALQLITPVPKIPIPPLDDASTGIAQIFAATAIDSINHAIATGLITGNRYDVDNWKDVEYIWNKLHTDKQFSIETCALVLIRAANLIGLPSNIIVILVLKLKILLHVIMVKERKLWRIVM